MDMQHPSGTLDRISVTPQPLFHEGDRLLQHDPFTVPEQLIYPFRWYFQGVLRDGMRFHNELYGFMTQFDRHDRIKAFELAYALGENGGQSVISVANATEVRRVWLNLRHWNVGEQLTN